MHALRTPLLRPMLLPEPGRLLKLLSKLITLYVPISLYFYLYIVFFLINILAVRHPRRPCGLLTMKVRITICSVARAITRNQQRYDRNGCRRWVNLEMEFASRCVL